MGRKPTDRSWGVSRLAALGIIAQPVERLKLGGNQTFAKHGVNRHSLRMKVVVGCGLSAIYFLFLGLLVLGNMLGDCFPELGHYCPTDHERNDRIVVTMVIGVAIYAIVGMFIERYFRSRSDKP